MNAGTLTLDRLTRTFGGEPAVNALSLEAKSGELLVLIGDSGSGKTTTLRMAAGYEMPDSGRVLLDGRDITRLPPQRRAFGMVFQHYALFPHLTVGANVGFGLEARGVPRRQRESRVAQALATVGLAGAAPRPVQSLSGGEQQRVALARAVVFEPQVVLLDEPLSNLDPTLRRAMRDELRATFQRLGVTALFVTHDQEDAFALADRVALMRRGVLLQVATPEVLYDRPVSRAVAEFIGRSTFIRGRLDGDHVTLSLGGAARRIPAVAPPALVATASAEVFAVVRPDALAFAAEGTPDAWPAVVVGRRFFGTHVNYRLRVESADGPLELELETTDRGPAEGEQVWVALARPPVAVVGV